MKVCVPTNRKNTILKDPVWGFPFSWWQGLTLVNKPEEADAIFIDFGVTPYTGEVKTLSEALFKEPWFKDHAHKCVWVTSCDYPHFSQVPGIGIKFVLSPLPGKDRNIECNVHPIPLHLCPGDYRIQMDQAHTDKCRTQPKHFDFGFIGNVSGGIARHLFGGRMWIRKLYDTTLNGRMFLRDAAGWAYSPTWVDQHKEWMERMGQCRYAFCPAGASNGPRPWWAMQVGCVPIFTDVEHLPFEDEVDWDSLCFKVPSDEKLTFDYLSLPTGDEYQQMRMNCLAFWEEYCWMPNLAMKMKEKICAYLSQARADSSLITSLSTYYGQQTRAS